MLLIRQLSDVSFLELISDAIKTCLIFGCSCSSRAVSYFCHNSLRTNCLESALFVSVWSSQSNQAVTDIYSALPQSWKELICVQMNGLSLFLSMYVKWFVCCVCVMFKRIWASYSVLSIYLSLHTELWSESIFIWIGITGGIFFLAALSLRDFITPVRPAKHIG